jgi:hypothetical protein
VFTARYALSPHIKQIRFVFKGLIKDRTKMTTKIFVALKAMIGKMVRRMWRHVVWYLSNDNSEEQIATTFNIGTRRRSSTLQSHSNIHQSFLHGAEPLVGPDLSMIEASRSHSDTPHSVGPLWTSDQPDAETSTWQNTTLTTDINASGGLSTHNLRSERLKIHALDRAVTGVGTYIPIPDINYVDSSAHAQDLQL